MSQTSITEREFEILLHLANGKKSEAVAATLEVSTKTIESHRDKIKRKLGLPGGALADFIAFALTHGLITRAIIPEMAGVETLPPTQQLARLNFVLQVRAMRKAGATIQLPPVHGRPAKT